MVKAVAAADKVGLLLPPSLQLPRPLSVLIMVANRRSWRTRFLPRRQRRRQPRDRLEDWATDGQGLVSVRRPSANKLSLLCVSERDQLLPTTTESLLLAWHLTGYPRAQRIRKELYTPILAHGGNPLAWGGC